MNLYPFIEAEELEQRNVSRSCVLLEVSRSAYYCWAAHTPSLREVSDAELAKLITEIHTGSRGTYGAPRVHAELKDQGVACGRKRVARLMRREGLVGVSPRRCKTTTIADPDADPIVDLVKRAFGPDTIELDTIYAGDITYVRTWEGWLYLATVIDLGSRRVVGWSMADHMRAELVCDALGMAIEHRRPGALIFHSDRGSQYTSGAFASLCDDNGVTQSMSRPGQCWDNAVAESFFAALKNELIYRNVWATRAEARQAMFEYIEVFLQPSAQAQFPGLPLAGSLRGHPPWQIEGGVNPVREDHATITCALCGRSFVPKGRQRHCTTLCRQRAWRRVHAPPQPPAARMVKATTVYECDGCGNRYLGIQRCEDCNTFARKVGPGGSCPHCQEPVALADLTQPDHPEGGGSLAPLGRE